MIGGAGAGLAGEALFGGQQQQMPQQAQPEQQQRPSQSLDQIYPEVFQVVKQYIDKGVNPEDAAFIVKNNPKIAKMVSQIEKDTGKAFEDIVLELFGQNKQQAPQPQMQQQTQGQKQGGQGQQALMAILQKIQQQRGGR